MKILQSLDSLEFKGSKRSFDYVGLPSLPLVIWIAAYVDGDKRGRKNKACVDAGSDSESESRINLVENQVNMIPTERFRALVTPVRPAVGANRMRLCRFSSALLTTPPKNFSENPLYN